MKHIFIVNPVSGKGKAVKFIPFINEYFMGNSDAYEIIVTEKPKDATSIAHRYTKEDDVVLYSLGGDGTAKEILDGLNEGVTMCVVPGGTGNDFYKSVDGRRLSDNEILKGLIEGENILIDYGILNGTSRFMNIASFGVDADINVYACDVLKVKYNIPGKLVYAIAALMVGTKPQNIGMDITVDGLEFKRTAVLAAIANGKCYGGTFKPAPDGIFDDGYFDFCIVNGPIPLKRFFQLIVKYAKGAHVGEKEVEMIHAKHIKIKFDHPVNLQIDGENYRMSDADIKIVPHGLSIRVPRSREVK